MFRAGDTVKHGPSGETWGLACDEDHGEVVCCGWPETQAQASDCTLVEAASDEERAETLRSVAAIRPDRGYSYRQSLGAYQLHTSKLCGGNCSQCQAERVAALAAAERAVIEAAVAWRAAALAEIDTSIGNDLDAHTRAMDAEHRLRRELAQRIDTLAALQQKGGAT